MPSRHPQQTNTSSQSSSKQTQSSLVSKPFAQQAQPELLPESAYTAEDTQEKLERAARAGHRLSQLAIAADDPHQGQTMQAKIEIPQNVHPQFSSDQAALPVTQLHKVSSQTNVGDMFQRAEMPEEDQLQLKSTSEETQQQPNNTGLPDQLKQGVEHLSGMSLDDVNVHFNSSKPSAINAHAYAQGTEIHVAPGQEQHLPHEAWHVAQQKQGRVKPTQQLAGAAINDDPALEKEADEMGAKAAQRKVRESNTVQRIQNSSLILQRQEGVIQKANYPNLDGPVDANSIKETQYGTGEGQVTFPGIDSCIGIVGRSGSSLTGVHLVMVDAAGTFMVEGSGFDEVITATAASVVSVLGKPEEIRVFGEASDWKDGIPSFFKILGGATGKLSYASNAQGDITVTWDETAGWSS